VYAWRGYQSAAAWLLWARGGGLPKARGKALKRRRGGCFGRRGVAWRIAASATAARRLAGFVYMNQQLARGFKTFSSVKQFVSRKFCQFHGHFYVPRPPPVDFLGKK